MTVSFSTYNPNRPLLIEAYKAGIVKNTDLLFEKYQKMVDF